MIWLQLALGLALTPPAYWIAEALTSPKSPDEEMAKLTYAIGEAINKHWPVEQLVQNGVITPNEAREWSDPFTYIRVDGKPVPPPPDVSWIEFGR